MPVFEMGWGVESAVGMYILNDCREREKWGVKMGLFLHTSQFQFYLSDV